MEEGIKVEILSNSEQRYQLICEASADGLWDYDLINKDRFYTEKWYNNYGITKEEFGNPRNWINLIHPEDVDMFLKYRNAIKKGKGSKYSVEYRILARNGGVRWFIEKCMVKRDETGSIQRIAGSHTDITDIKQQNKTIEKLAYYDTLTELPNRTYLIKKLGSILYDADLSHNSGVLMHFDIDDFNLINNFFGHELGDKVIKYIGIKIWELFKEDNNVFVSRSGGDEYTILIEKVSSEKEINKYINKIMKLFKEKFEIEGNELYIAVSMGATYFPQHGTSTEVLLKNVDIALHKAKDAGKNCYKIFEKNMNDAVNNKVTMQGKIREGLANEEFCLYYQPQIDTTTGKLSGFEALVRWKSTKYGMIYPDEFIKIAEESGFIVAIGKLILKAACQFCKKINANSQSKLKVAVNVSAVELMQSEFVDNLKEIVEASGVKPELMEFEITESVLMESFTVNKEKLMSIKEYGSSIALDDFGTGYSSLNYIKQLPIDILKIDKSFIDDMSDTSFVDLIIILAHRIGIEVVAEGVETKAQEELLTRQKCDKIQGYFFSKPIPEEEALMFMEKYK